MRYSRMLMMMSLFSIVSIKSMDNNGLGSYFTNSMVEVSGSAWQGITNCVYSAASSVASAPRAIGTRVHPEVVYGIGLPEEQKRIEIQRTRSVVSAANQYYNDYFSSSEDDLPVDQYAGIEVDHTMLAKRLAAAPDTLEFILKRPNTDVMVLEDIKSFKESMNIWMPVAITRKLDRKEKRVKSELEKRIKPQQGGKQ